MLVKGDVADQFMMEWFEIDLLIVLASYFVVADRPGAAMAFAFGLGLLLDCYSAGLLGLFSTAHLLALLAMYVGSLLFDTYSLKSVFILATVGVWVKGILFLMFLSVFSLETGFSFRHLLSLVPSGLVTGLTAPFVFYVLDGIQGRFNKKSGPVQV